MAVRRRVWAWALALALGAAGPLWAQFTTASFGGQVKDASGGVVAGATVRLRDTGTGQVFTQRTAAQGRYLFPALPVGAYQLTVVKAGFQTFVQKGIILNVNEAATQPVVLQVGTASQQVTVTANAPLVTTRSAAVGQLVNRRSIVNLPLDGRTAQSLVFLVPGAADVTNNYCGAGCEGGAYPGEQYADINGGGPNGVNYQLDGADNNDTYMNTNLPFPNPDALQEFSVQTGNMSAEYGNAVSGVVNIVTKSGTNQFHGDLFEFLRNDAFDARNFFAPTRDVLKQNQFGGTFGGPIFKNKLFFFASYQGEITRTAPNGNIAVVPTVAERGGDFGALCSAYDASGLCTPAALAAGGTQLSNPNTGQAFAYNQIPSGDLSTPAQNFLKYLPLPNEPDGVLNYLGPAANSTDNQFLGKIDYYLGAKQHISGHYFFTRFNEPAPAVGNDLLAMSSNANRVRVQTIALNDTYVSSPTLLFNTWYGWNQQVGGYVPSAPFSANALGVNMAPSPSPQLNVTVDGYFAAASSNVGAYNRGGQTLREVVTWVKGNQQLTFGGEMLRITAPISNQYLQGGTFDFGGGLSGNDLADFILGDVTQFMQAGGIYADITGYNWAAFIQDNWHALPSLTLSAGLRWNPYLPYTDSEGRLPCFLPGHQSQRFPNAPAGLLFAGDSGCPAGTVQRSLGEFAPRLGFADRLTADGKTSLRGGFGLYYQPPETLAWQDDAGVAPFAPVFTLNGVSFANPWTSGGLSDPFPAQFGPKLPPSNVAFTLPATVSYFFAPNFKPPVITTWNLTLERQLGNTLLVRAAYFGNHGEHLFGTSDQEPMADINAAVYVPGNSTEANTQQRRPYPNFGPMGFINSDYDSNYNALQLTLQKRMSHGLSFLADYTWSRNFNDFSESVQQGYYQTNPYSNAFNYGPASSDLPQVFKLSGTWQLPNSHRPGPLGTLLSGWAAAPILTWQSGFPFTVMSGLDNSFSGDFSDRADLTGGGLAAAPLSAGRSNGAQVQQYFNTAVFVPNALGTFGDEPKNGLRGPGLFNTDLAILKNTQVGEHDTVQFRAELYNAFNNVNFGMPDAVLTDPQFGQLTYTATSPRIIQFGLKFLF
ncbi:MAG: carboxypeptidase regulatory-like domain-containing protein [Terriglobales bacterium]